MARGELADRARQIDNQLNGPLDPPGEWQVKIGDALHDVVIDADSITVDGEEVDLSMTYTPGEPIIVAEIGEEEIAVKVEMKRMGFRLTTRGAIHDVRVLPARIAKHAHHMIEKIPPDLSRFLICPMPGLLVRLDVAEGDQVEIGQPLAVIEAMKMENILRAEKAGTVKSVNAKAGDSLAVDAIILELE